MAEAQEWAFNRTELATQECMTALGFVYLVRASADLPDPNIEAMQSLAEDELDQFSMALWGEDVVDPTDESCEATATLRVFPINSLQHEWDTLQEAVFAAPEVKGALDAELSCVRESGFEGLEDATQEVARDCEQSSGIVDELRIVNERLEMAFLIDHAQFFIEFKTNLPQP